MSTNPTPTDPAQNQSHERKQTELSVLRRQLANKCDLIHGEDPDLYEEIKEWLSRSSQVRDGNIGSAVNSKLRELKRENKMRDHRGVDEPEDAFPDECQECEFYGVACPMVGRHSVKKSRERIIKNAESDEELVNALTDLAINWDCQVVLDELEEYQESEGKFLQEGYGLLFRATEVLHPDADTDTEITFDEGPSPADKKRVDETVSEVMGDEEGDET